MSFKFDPNGAQERKYITKPGIYEVVVKAFTPSFLPPRNDFYVRIALENTEGESVFADIFQKAEKNGSHERLNQFVAATAAIGRRLKVKVTERKYVKKDGTEGVAYQGSFFFRHPDGPELPF